MQPGIPCLLAVTILAPSFTQMCFATVVHHIETASSTTTSTLVTTNALDHGPRRSDCLYRTRSVAQMAPIDTTRTAHSDLTVIRKRKGGRGGGGGRGSGSSSASGGTSGATQVGAARSPGVSGSTASSRHGGDVIVVAILSYLAGLVMLDLFV
ncbi:hypothetical protein BDZ85DRAFT_265045 [Elsinoe ampelina]|uniref:Uncharacterized protein n=1 Tax=Elsinoe ampelina TaxID=302913 RepID=A0A6A6G9Z1_9PEZI|nr:hypothetical protein BDZ85DRAFT_265045 [Elsinoe ampelina]